MHPEFSRSGTGVVGTEVQGSTARKTFAGWAEYKSAGWATQSAVEEGGDHRSRTDSEQGFGIYPPTELQAHNQGAAVIWSRGQESNLRT